MYCYCRHHPPPAVCGSRGPGPAAAEPRGPLAGGVHVGKSNELMVSYGHNHGIIVLNSGSYWLIMG